MQKEILTLERCRQDLAELVQIHSIKLLLPVIGFGVAALALLAGYLLTAEAVLLVFTLLFAACFWMLLTKALLTILRLRRLQRSPFDLVIDRLESTDEAYEHCNYDRLSVEEREEMLRCYGYERGRFTDLPVWTLTFQSVGAYRVPVRPHYRWSDRCRMSSLEVFESATPGDSFYVVVLQDKGNARPMMIYHTEYFEYRA
ncbi:MAG: hypothetical protein IJW62_00370 [Clostridia bacterium]|nr:hypothetical protein [Clostridia bacterium]